MWVMKKTITIISLFLSFCVKAQVFTGGGGGILNNGTETFFNLSVSGLTPAILDSTFGIETVCVNINHPTVQELYIYLQSPSGEIVELTEGTSCTGIGYSNTCFNNNAATSITLGTTPYTGSYRPVGYFGRFNTGEAGNGTWQLIVKDAVAFVDSGNVVSWSITFGNTPAHPVKFTSSNLPIVIINTNNQPIGNTAILVDMGIIDNGTGVRNNITDPWNNYNGKTTIHIRGNSTRYFEKKSFSLQTSDALGNQVNVPLLGMPSDNDWDIVAPYQDKSLIRSPLGYDLFREMGHYSSRLRSVEVVVNNEYRGIYLFQESPKQGKNRVDVTKMLVTDNSVPQVTGGYIIKVDRPGAVGTGWYSLMPGDSTPKNHFFYAYDYPKEKDLTSSQKTYIQSVLDTFETVMSSDSFASPTKGYPKLIEVNSFIDYLIIQELSKNTDAYRISTYMYKDNVSKGGKLHIGPVWDFGIAWHNCNYGNAFNPVGWQFQLKDSVFPTPIWWNRFMQDSSFVNNLYCRWHQLRSGILSSASLNSYIDSSASALTESEPRNFVQWPVLGAYIWPDPQNQVGATYQAEVNDLKTWITNRLAWMDGAITGHCLALGIQENNFNPVLSIYPNPFTSAVTFKYEIKSNSKVSLELFNIMGSRVMQVFDGNKTKGIYQEDIGAEKIAPGIYNLKLTVDDHTFNQKLIKLSNY